MIAGFASFVNRCRPQNDKHSLRAESQIWKETNKKIPTNFCTIDDAVVICYCFFVCCWQNVALLLMFVCFLSLLFFKSFAIYSHKIESASMHNDYYDWSASFLSFGSLGWRFHFGIVVFGVWLIWKQSKGNFIKMIDWLRKNWKEIQNQTYFQISNMWWPTYDKLEIWGKSLVIVIVI